MTLHRFKRKAAGLITNYNAWRTNKKIITIISDDWGSIRTASKQAKENLLKGGLNFKSRFDHFDVLENANDLSGLFEVLTSVKDKNGNPAVFTPYALPANPDFEKIIANNYSSYHYELLTDTFNKLPNYGGVMNLWKEGIQNKIFCPQLHGREHMNVNIMLDLLRNRDKDVMACFENRSYTGLKTPGYLATFGFKNFDENEYLKQSIIEGVLAFEKVFGYKPSHFTPPQGVYNRVLEPTLKDCGIDFIDIARKRNEPLGTGNFSKVSTWMGKRNNLQQTYTVRNAMFERDSTGSMDWVDFCMTGIQSAFIMKTPAIITTHRVNFCGGIETHYRDKGLKDLKRLLTSIVNKWPDVEFLSMENLGLLMKN